MNPTDSRTQAAIDVALGHIGVTVASAVDRAAELLGGMASSATRIYERDAFLSAQADLRHKQPAFMRSFNDGLRDKVALELKPRHDPQHTLAGASWESLSLVDDEQVEERMFADRIGQVISHECEWELRELAAYMGALLRIGRADQDRNPFRPDVLGAALYRAIESVATERESRRLLARELGPVVAKGMRLCYVEIVRDLQSRSIQPVNLSVRGVEGPGNDRVTSGYASLPRDDLQVTSAYGGSYDAIGGPPYDPVRSSGMAPTRPTGWGQSAPGSVRGGSGRFAESGRSGAAPAATSAGGFAAGRRASGAGENAGVSDAEMMSLIRRLTFLASRSDALTGDVDRVGAAVAPASRHSTGGLGGGGDRASAFMSPLERADSGRGGGTGGLRGDGLTGLMAVNLIRAHRDELRSATTGTLDHMVIDVVGSLFDQILSDSRVPPQMARQIARLQLPVLRVALSDPSFFSSRKHPVRRFVNRIASLACAFDEFDDGPGQQFLARVGELVQEIIEGDFDQVDVYSAKLTVLEAFIEQQTESNVQANGSAATLLDGKESELRVQQRYMQQLQSALAPLAMHEYLRDFLAQVWSQALALAARRDGPAAERTQRLRRTARDLVLSVQPKGTPALRKAFLMQLPGLMKDLHEGLKLIGWPESAQKEFFGKLLPSHAESLKGQAPSELDRNLLTKQLEAVFSLPLPRADQLGPLEPVSPFDSAAVERNFSTEEVQQVGLVEEKAVDWERPVDIDLTAEPPDSGGGDEGTTDLDVDLSVASADPAEPSEGPQLMNHVKVGFAYQMHLKDGWQKVRLSYVSQGRSFFVFTHGKRHKETLSLTARMLARMCETGRLRAFESSYLLERATARARKQLAAMKGAPSIH